MRERGPKDEDAEERVVARDLEANARCIVATMKRRLRATTTNSASQRYMLKSTVKNLDVEEISRLKAEK